MDGVIVTAAVILAVIALIEIVTLFCAKPFGKPVYIAVIPIFSEDGDLPAKLERLAMRSLPAAVLLNVSATEEQLQICRQFVRDNQAAEIVNAQDFEEYLARAFGIREEGENNP